MKRAVLTVRAGLKLKLAAAAPIASCSPGADLKQVSSVWF